MARFKLGDRVIYVGDVEKQEVLIGHYGTIIKLNPHPDSVLVKFDNFRLPYNVWTTAIHQLPQLGHDSKMALAEGLDCE